MPTTRKNRSKGRFYTMSAFWLGGCIPSSGADRMRRMRRAYLGLIVALGHILFIGGPLSAQDLSIVRSADGMTYTYKELGNGFGLLSNPHAPPGVAASPEPSRLPLSVSPDLRQPGTTVHPFPPTQLSPAPALPFTPHGPVVPSERSAHTMPASPGLLRPNASGGLGTANR